MLKNDTKQTIENAIKDAVGQVFDSIDVTEEVDHDGDPSLFVTVRYRRGIDQVDQSKVLNVLHDRLLASGESRFPYIKHVYPDDPLPI